MVAITSLFAPSLGAQQSTPSVEELRTRAEEGDAEAQYSLGMMYQNGKGVPQDYTEALRWYRRAAEQGFASAQNNLGFAYKNFPSVLQDYAEAAKWYRLAAEQGALVRRSPAARPLKEQSAAGSTQPARRVLSDIDRLPAFA